MHSEINTEGVSNLQNRLLESILVMQNDFIKRGIYYGWCKDTIENLLFLSESEFGFICELLQKDDGTPFIKSHGITNIAWDGQARQFYEENKEKGLEFFNFESLWGKAVTTGEPVISNDPDNDNRRGGYPKDNGHPRLKSFLGLPIKSADGKVVGVMGVANRPNGYDDKIVDFLSPFVASYGLLIEKSRIERDRKRVEEQLIESEERYRALFENMMNGFALHEIICDDEGHPIDYRFLSVNTEFERLTGLPGETILGKTVLTVLPNTEKHWIEKYGYVAMTGAPIEFESFSQELDRHFLVTAYSPAPQQLACILKDISYLKQAEDALRKQNYYFEKTQELGHIGTWEIDLINNILLWTDENCRIFGVPEGSVVDYETFIDKVHPDDREYVDREWKAGVEGKPYDIEHRVLLDGEVRWVREKADIVFDDKGKAVSAIGFTQDITERKKAENALKENEQRYKSAQRLGKVGNWEYNLVTETFWGSEQAKRIYGFDPDGERFSIDEVENCIPERERVHQALIDLIEKDIPYNLEFEIHPVTGPKTRTIKSIAEIRRDDSGAPLKVVGVIQDITDQKRIERQLIQGQKMESIGKLAGGIAHDFNNILSSIIGFAELALDETSKGTTLEDSLQEVYSAGKRAKDLVKQILAFARQSEEKRKPFQPRTVATEVLKFMRSTIPTSIEIRQNIESESWVMGNTTQMNQVLLNLCTNASHAMEDSGGVLNVSMKDVSIEKAGSRIGIGNGEYVQIQVSDTGTGIAPEIIRSIFDPYFTTKGPGEGTGMGLAMVQGVVESYSGKITVESELGKGTTFTIYLPITKRRSAQGEYLQTQLPTGTERILFIDDEASIAKMGSQMLERLGYSVTPLTDSVEALKLFQSKPDDFDLVVTDVTMPNMTGDKLAVELMKIRQDIPVILCTGYSKKISSETTSNIGIKAFAYKPVAKADLAKTVRKILDEAQLKNQQSLSDA